MTDKLHDKSRRAEAWLEEVVMAIFHEAYEAGELLRPKNISIRAGIFREPGHAMKRGNDAIVWGVLGKLAKANRIQRNRDRHRLWEMTKSEIKAYQSRKK